MFSQLGDKKATSPSIPSVPSVTPEKTSSTDYGSIIFAIVLLVLTVGFLAFVILYVAPEGARKNLQKEAEHQASIQGPKVLAELVDEMRLLRSEVSLLRFAVENLAAQ
jgi:hypothetical protein